MKMQTVPSKSLHKVASYPVQVTATLNSYRYLFSAYSLPDNVVSNMDSGLAVDILFCSRLFM